MKNGVWFATVCFKEWEVDLNNLDINDDSTPIYEHIRIYGFCHEYIFPCALVSTVQQ